RELFYVMDHSNNCRHFIPLARSELVELLAGDKGLAEGDRTSFRTFCDLLTTAYHFEYHGRLLELKAAYLPFDPDADTTALIPLSADQKQHRLNDLFSDFGW